MVWAVAASTAVLVLVFALNRRLSYLLFGIVLITGVTLWVVTERDRRQSTAQREALFARATSDAGACPDPDLPLLVEFRNGGERMVEQISFELTARKKGQSSVAYRAFLRDDKIVGPGETSVTCYGLLPHGFTNPRPVSVNLEDYDWTVDISLVSFGH